MDLYGSFCKYYTTACGIASRRTVVPTPSKLTKVRCIGIISWLMPSSSLTKTRDGVTRRFSSSTRPRPRWRSKKKVDRNVRYTLAEWLTVRRAFLDSWPFPLDAVTTSFERDWFVMSSKWLETLSWEELAQQARSNCCSV